MLLTAHSAVQAQLSGTYTVGGIAPDYATINAAVADLMAQGVSAPVEMAIRPGVYTEQLHIMAIPGASATNRVMFRSEGYDSASVTVFFESVVSWESVFWLDNVSFIDMVHITFLSASLVPHHLGLISNGSHHNRIMNCKLEGTDQTNILLYSTNTCDSANTVMNNLFLGGDVGVNFEGYFSNYEKNNRIIGNVCLKQKGIGIQIRSQISQIVVGNEVHIVGVTPASPYIQGIDTGISTGKTEVSHNRVTIELDSGTHVMGIYCSSMRGTANDLVKFYNNTVYVRVHVLDSVGDGVKGIEFKYQPEFIDLAHNSVRVEAYAGTVANKSQALVYPSSFSNGRIHNNILANLSAGQIGAVAVRVLPTSPATVETVTMDYNDLYSEGTELIKRLGTPFSDLSAWQQATGNDPGSVSVHPQFTDSLLHLPCGSALTGTGVLLSAVPQDFDGIFRNDPPTIGAYELNPSDPLRLYPDTVLCQGQTLTLSPRGTWNSYLWQDGSTATTHLVTQAGVYHLTVTDQCGTISDTVHVAYIQPPTVNLGNDTLLCPSETLLLNAATDSAIYLWQNGSTDSTFLVTQTGIYHVEVTNQCGTDRDTVMVNYISPPTVQLGNDTLLCDGEAIVLNAASDSAAYQWQDNSTDSSFTVTAGGTYHVTVTNLCGMATDTLEVQYLSPPLVNLGNDTLLCPSETLLLNAAIDSAAYIWQNGSTDSTFLVAQTGIYHVEVTNQCGIDSDTVTVNYISPPSVNLGIDTLVCVGQTITLAASADSATYLWQDNSTDSTFSVTENGTYHLTITNQCGTASDTVEVLFLSTPVVNLGNDALLCLGQSLLLIVSADSATYVWQDGSVDSTFSVTQAGGYHVEATNQCGTDMDTVAVNYIAPPSVQLPNDTALCDGQTITLAVSADSASYIWQDNSADSNFVVMQTGTYQVTAANQCGTASDMVVVTYLSPPSVNLGNDTLLCPSETLLLTVSADSAIYTWQDGSTDSTFTVTQTGIYHVQAINLCGTDHDTISVTYDVLPQVSIGSDTVICMGDTLVLVAVGEGLAFQWQDGSSDAFFLVTEEGVYWAMASHPCGTVGDTVHISLLDCDTIPGPIVVPNAITPNGDGMNDVFYIDELPPNSQLFIYNRWGRRIYRSENYLNDWNADGMADGTYFYVLTLPNGEALRGYVMVVKE